MLISVSRKSAEPKSSLKFSKPDELLALLVEDAEEDRPQQRIEEEDPDGDERRSDEDVGLEPRLPLLGEPLDEPVEHEEEEQRAADADRDGDDAVDDLAHDCLLSVRLGDRGRERHEPPPAGLTLVLLGPALVDLGEHLVELLLAARPLGHAAPERPGADDCRHQVGRVVAEHVRVDREIRRSAS